ncbi:MAG: PmoA family protein [Gemmatimonadota bacterium]
MIDIELRSGEYKAVVTIDGQLFTEYRYGHFVCRPYFYPVLTPGGQRLTRAWPAENVEGENQDHYHHRSIYVAHGLVNGFNLWDEGVGHGAMLQRGEPSVGLARDEATIEGIVDWFGPEGQRLVEERRSIRIRPEGDLRILDHCSELHAKYGDVVLGDTKEGGLFSIRVPTSMDAKDRGRIENSEGLVFENGQGEETTWGKRAAWVDYSGPLANGEEWGHLVVDHQRNPRHPTYWHVRGYGLFTANPFGVHDFKGDKSIDESLTIRAGQVAVFRYRLIVHPGRGAANPRLGELVAQFQRSALV